MNDLDAGYIEFCYTDTQRKYLEAVIKHGSQAKAATALGINRRTLDKCMASVRLNAAKQGYSPAHGMQFPTPPTHFIERRTVQRNGDGLIERTWDKWAASSDSMAIAMREAAEAFKEDLPRYKPAKSPKIRLNGSLLNQFVITDFHLGMLAWKEETGANWDTDKAADILVKWFARAIDAAPKAATAIFAQLGDFIHWDGLVPVTPTSGHVLDADTRFQRVVRVAIRVIRQIISMLLERHERVHVIMADANHDPASGVWLREWLAHVYEFDPRVTVDNSAGSYYAFQFGKVMLGFHHGHKRGPKQLDQVLVSMFPEMYGATKYRYIHSGHLHHDWVVESALARMEQHRTLAAKDDYAARSGYLAGRDAKVITYHNEFGEVCRSTITPEMLGVSDD
jgi:hypothetical protein